jgi:hypothetical protein
MRVRPRDIVYGRRVYVPGGPVFARRALTYNGVRYAAGEALPAMSTTKHKRLWLARKVDHAPRKSKAAPVAVAPEPVIPPGSSPGWQKLQPNPTGATTVPVFGLTPGETINVETPAQAARAKFKRR